jgi:hypothetical protein
MGASSWVKRGKRDIAELVERARVVIVVGLMVWCGRRERDVRSDCISVLVILLLYSGDGLWRRRRGLYIQGN